MIRRAAGAVVAQITASASTRPPSTCTPRTTPSLMAIRRAGVARRILPSQAAARASTRTLGPPRGVTGQAVPFMATLQRTARADAVPTSSGCPNV